MYAIEAHNISKVFRIYERPSDRLKEIIFRKRRSQEFVALRDISFEVPIGQTMGIIGENGAGKSTLLKILAGTLTPTGGELVKRGRVAALLELGAGFHPEFTGRQNIYLNAALLGLTEDDIRRLEEGIIEFSGLKDFIHRPVKTYSSGMHVRLAFSIATSVDPDILIIDEALSVGDQRFQKKCVDRMMGFKDKGKTIVFCSHSMYFINQLCSTAMWLEHGAIRQRGAANDVSAAYEDFARGKTSNNDVAATLTPLPSIPPIFLKEIRLNGTAESITIRTGEGITVSLSYESSGSEKFLLAVGIRRNDGLICHAVSMAKDGINPMRGPGQATIILDYKKIPFLHGQFSIVGTILDEHGIHCYHQKESAPFFVTGPASWEEEIGLLHLDYSWKLPAG